MWRSAKPLRRCWPEGRPQCPSSRSSSGLLPSFLPPSQPAGSRPGSGVNPPASSTQPYQGNCYPWPPSLAWAPLSPQWAPSGCGRNRVPEQTGADRGTPWTPPHRACTGPMHSPPLLGSIGLPWWIMGIWDVFVTSLTCKFCVWMCWCS